MTTAADSGPGSLRAVVNTAGAGDAINFDPSLDGQRITLTGGQIVLTKNLAIDAGPNAVEISGGNASRIFYNADPTLNDTISNLTLMSGLAKDQGAPDHGTGGAIYDIGDLQLVNDTFSQNSAAGHGGAVYDDGGQIRVTDCTFDSNNAPGGFGGAIFTTNSLTVTGSTFTNNTAAGDGGAIAFRPTTVNNTDQRALVITNSTFTNNTATAEGGAIDVRAQLARGTVVVTISGSLFSNNKATRAGSYGGGLHTAVEPDGAGSFGLVLWNDTFYLNSADQGGAVAVDGTGGKPGLIQLSSLTITANTAATQGGGVWLHIVNPLGAGIWLNAVTPYVGNSIIAGNNLGAGAPAGNGPDIWGAVTSAGWNLIGKTDGSNGWAAAQNDQTGTVANPLNPGLDPKGPTYNGGPTLTIQLQNNSPALNTGDPTWSGQNGAQDQRGYKRANVTSTGAYDPGGQNVGAIPVPDAIIVASSANPAAAGQAVTLTVTVVGADGGTPTGPVTLLNGDTVLGTADLIPDGLGADAVFTTSFSDLGQYLLTAEYEGDDTYAAAAPTSLLQVVGVASSISLTSSSAASLPGQSVTFTASVTGSDGGIPTGTVWFLDGGALLGTAALDNTGTAMLATSNLTPGSHTITAVYSGDDAYAASTSGALTQTVQQPATLGAASSVSLSSSASTSAPGQSVTFTAVVSGSDGGTPTGTVWFPDGDIVLGTATLDGSGTATFATSDLDTGSHTITAVYGGDATNVGSVSGPWTQTVRPYSTSTSLSSGADPSVAGLAVTFTASVFSSGGAPTGVVSFYDGTTLLGTGAVANGVATFTTSALPVGDHAITALYSGDEANANSYSGVLTQTVQLAATTTSLSSNADLASVGQAVTFTATVSTSGGDAPTGVVYFYDGTTLLGTGTVVNGVATFTTSSLSQGNHTITAVYGGDAANAGSDSDPFTETIGGLSQPPPPPPPPAPATLNAATPPPPPEAIDSCGGNASRAGRAAFPSTPHGAGEERRVARHDPDFTPPPECIKEPNHER